MPGLQTMNGKLSDTARHVVLPSGIVSTGWPAVRDTCSGFGVVFDSWQDGAGRVILAKRADGSYAASIGGIVISIPRQVGKTFLVGAVVFALCLLYPGLTVLWTSHRLRTAAETFGKMQAFAGRKKVKPHIKDIYVGSGDEEIQFHNGSRILFGARERGFGRGFDDVDVEVFDEAQILTENAVDDMVPATNTAKNPLLLFMGTPPKPTDPSEVFQAKRTAALSGDDEDTAYIEFSADRGCDPKDRKQWRKANPSVVSGRTPEQAVLRMIKNLSPDSFVREGLGVWDDDDQKSEIDLVAWAALEHLEEERPNPVALAVQVSEDRQWTHIGLAGLRRDGAAHLQVVESLPGTAAVAGRLAELQQAWRPVGIAIFPGGPSGSLIPALEQAKVEVTSVWAREVAAADAGFLDAVKERTIRHSSQPVLNIAIRAARKQPRGEAWVWRSNEAGTDIASLKAITLALYTLVKAPKPQQFVPRRIR